MRIRISPHSEKSGCPLLRPVNNCQRILGDKRRPGFHHQQRRKIYFALDLMIRKTVYTQQRSVWERLKSLEIILASPQFIKGHRQSTLTRTTLIIWGERLLRSNAPKFQGGHNVLYRLSERIWRMMRFSLLHSAILHRMEDEEREMLYGDCKYCKRVYNLLLLESLYWFVGEVWGYSK